MSVQVIQAVGADVVAGLLGNGFNGAIHQPGDAQYDEQRRALVPTFDSRPLVVAEAFARSDVQAAVRTAREYGVPIAVQATGHGTRVPADGGILLKTSAMTSLLIDPERRIAKVGPGVRWGAVLDAAKDFGLVALAGSSRDVGVTGYTLGGGVGWLARKFGYAADSVIRAEVVTADGRVVTATADEHPDLFWAIRGGTGNFGIVTSLEFRLYPVSEVYSGIVYFAADAATLKAYRDWTTTIPNDLSTAITLTTRNGRRVIGLKVLYAGEAALAEHLLKPLYAVAGPILDGELRTTPFAETAMGGTPARYLDLVDELPDDLLDALAALDGPTVEIRHWAGAMANPGPGAGPVGAPRGAVLADHRPGGPRARRGAALDRSHIRELPGRPGRASSAYSKNDHTRLRAIKRRYDPENLFRLNHNIKP